MKSKRGVRAALSGDVTDGENREQSGSAPEVESITHVNEVRRNGVNVDRESFVGPRAEWSHSDGVDQVDGSWKISERTG